MVRGINSFRQWFYGYEEQYTIIGGTACDLLMTEEGLHPAYEGYCLRREPCIISLANLACGVRAFGESEKIYVVENEMVFSELIQRLSGTPVTLCVPRGSREPLPTG